MSFYSTPGGGGVQECTTDFTKKFVALLDGFRDRFAGPQIGKIYQIFGADSRTVNHEIKSGQFVNIFDSFFFKGDGCLHL
jgi:hypothetical protein